MRFPTVNHLWSSFLGCLLVLPCQLTAAADKDPDWYLRQASWEETLRLSREALMKSEADQESQALAKKASDPNLKDFQSASVELVSGEQPKKFRVRVAGLKQLILRCDGGGTGVLAEPQFIRFDGKSTALTRSSRNISCLPARSKLEKLESALLIDGKPVSRGYLFKAREAWVTLDGKEEWFEAWVTVSEGSKGQKVRFTADWRSQLERAEQRQNLRNQIWSLIRRDFKSDRLAADQAVGDPENIWGGDWTPGDLSGLARRYANQCLGDLKTEASKRVATVKTAEDLGKVRELYQMSFRCRHLSRQLQQVNVEAVRRSVEDMAKRYADRYDAPKHRLMVEEFARQSEALSKALAEGRQSSLPQAEKLLAGVRGALLSNPLLDSGKILCVRRNISDGAARSDMKQKLGFISLNSHCHVTIARTGWDDEIVLLSDLRGDPKLQRIYKPDRDVIVRDLDLDFSGDRMMFSSLDAQRRWAAFEIGADGSGFKQVSPANYPDVDWFNPVYLPDGRVVLLSTASFQGLPCENGSRPMAQVYLFDPKSNNVRQLTYEQDSDYTPSITNDGRILYTRWEYSDLPHYFTRILMTMNPDGTSQLAFYGSGSYYPTALLHSRAIPGDQNKVVGIVGGHHDMSEIGRLVEFDTSLSRRYPLKVRPKEKVWGPEGSFLRIPVSLPAEQTGCVAEIPGWGKQVEGDVCDTLTANQFAQGKPYFTHPWPLDDKYFLVSAKTKPGELWGLYLVDVFDNITLLAEQEGAAFFEPILFQPRTRPPVIPDRIKPGEPTATVHIADIYNGPGLKNLPRGKVKSLRVFAYHFAYVGTGGHSSLGVEAGWDLKRILGTVPVEADGSVCFEIPANTPVSLQPLDEDGAALQLMRSWLVGMPGERVSCTGCHEDNRSSVPMDRVQADRIPPRKLEPWHGQPRPFAFEFEVYPVLQKNCIGCHSGEKAPLRKSDQGGVEGKSLRLQMGSAREAYDMIHPYVRRPGPESELPTLEPMEYHASTSPLVQMLKKGHHGVQLDREGWERLYAWIDLNVTFKGKWSPGDFNGSPQKERRAELAKAFANVNAYPEGEYDRVEAELKARPAPEFVKPAPVTVPTADQLKAPGFPMTAEQAAAAQKQLGEAKKSVELGNGAKVDLVRIPAGSFVMGSQDGAPDEQPRAVVKIAKSFWMGECEISNAQYREFDANHDTRYIDAHGKDHTAPGYIANHDNQPVSRVTWQRAMEFCRWLSQRTGKKVRLPTEAEWEWAARAGSESRFFFGGLEADFSPWANLADRSTRWNSVGFVASGVQVRHPYPPAMNFPLHEERFEDKWFVVDYVAQYGANPWGLKDVIGNVSEWTASSYRSYPYREGDGRNDGNLTERKVARGGSWNSRPREAGAAVRLAYETFQPVHDVGFRIVIEE